MFDTRMIFRFRWISLFENSFVLRRRGKSSRKFACECALLKFYSQFFDSIEGNICKLSVRGRHNQDWLLKVRFFGEVCRGYLAKLLTTWEVKPVVKQSSVDKVKPKSKSKITVEKTIKIGWITEENHLLLLTIVTSEIFAKEDKEKHHHKQWVSCECVYVFAVITRITCKLQQEKDHQWVSESKEEKKIIGEKL